MQDCFANSSLHTRKARHFWEVIRNQLIRVSSRTKKQKKKWDEEILYFSVVSPRFLDGTFWLSCQNNFSVHKASCNPDLNPQIQENSLSDSSNSRSYGDFYWISWGVSLNTAGNLFLSNEPNVSQLLASDVIYLHLAQVLSSIQNSVGKQESIRVKETSANASLFDGLQKPLQDQQGI